mgnify:CR=1 FL=1
MDKCRIAYNGHALVTAASSALFMPWSAETDAPMQMQVSIMPRGAIEPSV